MPAAELSPVFATLREGGHRPVDAIAMTGDVSQRRYFRVALSGKPASAILALYPQAMRTAARRYQIATALFSGAGLRVPAILATAEDGAWMLTEDLGLETIFDLRGQPFAALEALFQAAVETLPRIAALDRGLVAGLNPPLDESLLRRELAMTRRVFFEARGLALDGETVAALESLCGRLGSERRVACHRDLNVRNLVPLADGEVGIVDHQDLRLGPASYDLASLLNDSLFPPPAAEERLLAAAGALDRESYHRAASQRTLKAVGTYAAFADRSPRYLPLIAPTLRRALEHLARTPETAAVAPRLAEAWRGVLADGSLLH